ncbi:MAG: TadE/TadG family type IV pilus assembly protein [Candidatus Brocadiia bacterium]|jgi:hypothetical protein
MQDAECRSERPINGLSHSRERSALCALHPAFCTRRCARATALIETAIVLPLYMILLLGLLYFGYATLGQQRQDKATAYAAWQPGAQQAPQQAGALIGPGPFWLWNGPITPNPAPPGNSSATFGDTTLSFHGGSINGLWVRPTDEYYGMTINGTVFIPSQLVTGIYTIPGYVQRDEVFDRERIAVDLWNYALGSTTQSFTFVPGAGIVQNFNTYYTSFARYLNIDANPVAGAGLLSANDGTPPTITGPNGLFARFTCAALNGTSSGEPWFQRQTVESTMSYNPPYLPWITRDNTVQQNGDNNITNFLAWQNPNPPPTTATMDCDVTLRNSDPASARLGAEEAPQTAAALLMDVAGLLVQPALPLPDSMDNLMLNSAFTIRQGSASW